MSNATPNFMLTATWRVMPAGDRWRAFLATRDTTTASHPWTRRSAVHCAWRVEPVRASAARN